MIAIPGIDTSPVVCLAVWARTLAPFFEPQQKLHEFSEAEWARLWSLARSVDSATILRFWSIRWIVNIIVWIAVTFGFVFAAFMLQFLTELHVQAVMLMRVQAVMLIVCFIGSLIAIDTFVALPLALACSTKAMRARLTIAPGDAELAQKFNGFVHWGSWPALGVVVLLLVLFSLLYPYIPANPILSGLNTLLSWLSLPIMLGMLGFFAYRMIRWPPAEPR